MSDQRRTSGGGKVKILNSGEQTSLEGNSGAASAATTVAKSDANSRTSRRKVGTNLERSFADPGAGPSRQPQEASAAQQQQPRQVLKAGKPVASAPTPMQQRPMTELEKAFSEKTVQDQRWLLSFPLALKQLYFGFAESTNHEQTLLTLVNKFPELLAGNEQNPSPILVAIRKGNWIPAMHFIGACVNGQQTRQLIQRSSESERRTFLIEAVLRAGQVKDVTTDMSPAIKVMLSLSEACPELLSATDCNGRNPLHYCAEQSKLHSTLLIPLLTELRQLALTSQTVARRLGNALATGDIAGKKPIDLLTMTSAEATAAHEAMQNLMAELPVGADEESESDELMPQAPSLLLLSGAAAKDAICSALAQRQKSAEFVNLLTNSLSSADPRAFLLSTVEQPEKVALEWFGTAQSSVVKQALTDVGLAEFCDLVDRL